MRILLDECVNQRMRNHLPGHECQSARYAGFGGLKNGELLDAAEAAGFDVLVTVDRGCRRLPWPDSRISSGFGEGPGSTRRQGEFPAPTRQGKPVGTRSSPGRANGAFRSGSIRGI
jgi:hypothetical protein